MSAGDRDTLAALLAEHFRYGNREPELCGCRLLKWWASRDEDLPESEQPTEQAWEVHIADVLLASDWLADIRAETWIECLQAVSWALDHGPADQAVGYVLTNTPYRTTENTDAAN